jgi:hypothetical protein
MLSRGELLAVVAVHVVGVGVGFGVGVVVVRLGYKPRTYNSVFWGLRADKLQIKQGCFFATL